MLLLLKNEVVAAYNAPEVDTQPLEATTFSSRIRSSLTVGSGLVHPSTLRLRGETDSDSGCGCFFFPPKK